jgi:CheY-like chemotaxis protein
MGEGKIFLVGADALTSDTKRVLESFGYSVSNSTSIVDAITDLHDDLMPNLILIDVSMGTDPMILKL